MTHSPLYLADPQQRQQAQAWAEQLQLTLSDTPPTQGCYLLVNAQGLGLALAEEPKVAPVQVDLVGGRLAHRRQFGGGRGQAVAKACGLKAGISPRILDATAGLLSDAFVLASLGAEVWALERHPWVAALGQDAYQRASTHQDAELASILARLRLFQGQASQRLAELSQDLQAEVIYLDPMFPSSKKSAQVKKEMRLFHHLVGQDEDADLLLEMALDCASHRVVVKRPRHAPYLMQRAPQIELTGQANRFDIYSLKKLTRDAHS